MKTVEYNNIKYLIGKNAEENWNILDSSKKINDRFIWFHLNSFSSCYVIIQDDLNVNIYNQSEIEDYLIYGAELCKENTKYKNYKNLKIMYTTLDKLNKTNKIGEVFVSGKKKIICL
jgi:predicted ribosome quality control (RQC) complex YloA/Tae2 family protein